MNTEKKSAICISSLIILQFLSKSNATIFILRLLTIIMIN